jgi:mono/diheme cytochrome c family protein
MPGAQGSTQFGYPDSIAPAATYSNLDIGAVFDGIIRASSQMSSDGASVLEQTTATLDRTTDRFARVAEIQAKGQELRSVLSGNAEVLKASAQYAQALASNQLQYQHTVTRGDGQQIRIPDPSQPGNGPELPPNPPAPDNNGLAPVQAIFDRRCVQCHNEAKKLGGLSLSNASKLSGQEVENILDRVSTTDPKRIMPPPNPDGSPNEPLSAADKKVLFRAAQ